MRNHFPQIDISKLFDKDYIFQISPDPEGLYVYLGIVFTLMIIGAIIYKFFFKKTKELFIKLQNKIFSLFLTIGILGLVWIFCRYEKIPYISSRFILILLFVWFILWGIMIMWFKLIIMPRKIIKLKQQERFKKYLPKSKVIKN